MSAGTRLAHKPAPGGIIAEIIYRRAHSRNMEVDMIREVLLALYWNLQICESCTPSADRGLDILLTAPLTDPATPAELAVLRRHLLVFAICTNAWDTEEPATITGAAIMALDYLHRQVNASRGDATFDEACWLADWAGGLTLDDPDASLLFERVTGSLDHAAVLADRQCWQPDTEDSRTALRLMIAGALIVRFVARLIKDENTEMMPCFSIRQDFAVSIRDTIRGACEQCIV